MNDTDYIGKDKIIHGSVCFLISLYSTEAALAAALTKEYADSRSATNHFCIWDLAADLIGVILGTTVRLAISGKWNWI